ncbi:hypothetical protein ASZ78_003458 [Callipepla squamata]|uniref:snRNA-activating protein complex subunit 5 n=1 Tax=Callipepla squamata TaxID=9009 RepID=A0A226NPD1_CALSU|nr:hypothetical protein ASZ78_003458 [Callipepla squamata]
MLSRLQELRKEEETLLRVKAALHEQLTRLKVEELALRSMIRSREEDAAAAPRAEHAEQRGPGPDALEVLPRAGVPIAAAGSAPPGSPQLLPRQILGQMDNEAAINQTELQLGVPGYGEEAEEEEESDS